MTMIRPVFGDPAPKAKEADELVTFEELAPAEIVSEAAVFEVAAGSSDGDAPPSIDGDAQIAPCECGAEILLSSGDVGHTIQCPACADMMIVEEAGGTLTLRVVGALDDTDWKLEEFK
jgi:hypothetical protein